MVLYLPFLSVGLAGHVGQRSRCTNRLYIVPRLIESAHVLDACALFSLGMAITVRFCGLLGGATADHRSDHRVQNGRPRGPWMVRRPS